tara:strand:- start:8194 stop:8796 length:603 start_codon:yes stop_codon:yes gene_type:complete
MDKVDSTLIGLVLAGGRSRRMGQDKALMLYNGRTLIDHASSLLRAAGCNEVFVSRNAPGFLNDQIEDAGPLSGVHAALDKLGNSDSEKHTELLVLPVDMPQMTPELLKRLVLVGRERSQACYVENRFLPFYLPVSQNTKAILTHYLVDQSKRRVVGFLEEVNPACLKAHAFEANRLDNASHDDEAQWLNVNTPGDWPNEQ